MSVLKVRKRDIVKVRKEEKKWRKGGKCERYKDRVNTGKARERESKTE